jgi:hypothetical protein
MDAPHQNVPGWMRPRSSSIVQRFPITGARIKHRYAPPEPAQFLLVPPFGLIFVAFTLSAYGQTQALLHDAAIRSLETVATFSPHANRRYS